MIVVACNPYQGMKFIRAAIRALEREKWLVFAV